MKTHAKDRGSLGCGDTSLIPFNPGNSCWNANLENQSPHRFAESAQSAGSMWVSFATKHTLCVLLSATWAGGKGVYGSRY